MPILKGVNDLVVRFANVNGTGSASANNMFAKAVFRMGVPVSPKNIFPSNIQGLPTWYEVRVNGKGWLGRRDGIDIMIAINPQSFAKDVTSVRPGGYLIYDSTKPLHKDFWRADIHFIGIPMTQMTMEHFADPRGRMLYKNVIYVSVLCYLLHMGDSILKDLISEQYRKKEKLIPDNHKAVELGYEYAKANFKALDLKIEKSDKIGDRILYNGNYACGLGAVYAGATVLSWYPITPSTSVADAFEKYCQTYRKEKETGKNKYAIVQAEDELAAIGMVIGASWNGARAFTATSGPGISLMNEFLGLAYFAEIPVVLINVQRGGPSTGMPTRTQQSDILLCAYASHGDTKHPLVFPSTPTECFELTAESFDLADQLQTPVMFMTDLDLGMNDHLTDALTWDDNRVVKRGKVLSHDDLEHMKEPFGRYKDVDGDGIPFRTIPGTHPTKGSFFTRGTSRDEYAKYTEESAPYLRNMERLLLKWETAKSLMPAAQIYQKENKSKAGIVFFGTSTDASLEAMELLENEGVVVDAMRLRAFPFGKEVEAFIESHDIIYLVEQNRDAQMKSLIVNELETHPKKIISVLNYDGFPITANNIYQQIINKQ
ncbi:MAG: 2-oxoacid:acceptor oxidoreductase subunit alpha [Saprospiraceae bacterium]